MHSLIAHKERNVQAVTRDRATTCTRKNIYYVAAHLTLYRVYDQMKGTSKSWLDTVTTQEWVNEWDSKFEHRCPPGCFRKISGNVREVHLWKFPMQREYIGLQTKCLVFLPISHVELFIVMQIHLHLHQQSSKQEVKVFVGIVFSCIELSVTFDHAPSFRVLPLLQVCSSYY